MNFSPGVFVLLIVSTSTFAAEPKKRPSSTRSKEVADSSRLAAHTYVKFQLVDPGHVASSTSFLSAETSARTKLMQAGARFFSEDEAAVVTAKMKRENARGFLVRLTLSKVERGYAADVLVTSYPALSLRGSWRVIGSRGDAEDIIDAIVPRVMEDALSDLAWTKRTDGAAPAYEMDRPPSNVAAVAGR
jgi:hypothetical protein